MKKYELTDETRTIKGKTLYRIKALRDFEHVKAGDLGGFIESEKNLSHEGNCWVGYNACVIEDARVSSNAKVSDTARVSGDAWVSDNAQVSGNAWIFHHACVSGNAQISNNAWVSDTVSIFGKAQVFGDAQVFGNAQVSDNARVSHHTYVSGNTRVCGNAWIYGDARVCGNAWIYGDARVCGNAWISGNAICTARALICNSLRDHITVTDNYITISGMSHSHEHWLENYEEICRGRRYSEEEIKECGQLIKILSTQMKRQLSKRSLANEIRIR